MLYLYAIYRFTAAGRRARLFAKISAEIRFNIFEGYNKPNFKESLFCPAVTQKKKKKLQAKN